MTTTELAFYPKGCVLTLPYIPPRDAFPRAFEGHHWAKRAGIKQAMKDEIIWVVKAGGGPPHHPFEKAHITWTLRSPRGNYDGDNALAACKGWCDGLIAAQVIVNDSIFRVSHTIRWERAKKEETEIRVERC